MGLERSLRKFERELAELERLLPLASLRESKISAWSIGEQIEHAVAVSESILERIGEDRPSSSRRPLSLVGRIVLLSGFIPRGKGRSPESVLPAGASVEKLRERIGALRRKSIEWRSDLTRLSSNRSRFDHPFFGTFATGQWIRFVEIHQHHHLKIAREIAALAVR